MSLDIELAEKRKTIHTDAYPMSFNEVATMYRDGEIDLHPEFQRFFRWSDQQKSVLIESILLGLPLPSVFVYQRSDGILDVIDGVQRLSTVLQFIGVLKDSEGKRVEPLTLHRESHLPSLEGKVWERWQDDLPKENVLNDDQKRYIKRSKIDFKFVLRESDENAKFDLFQRLNTGGSPLSEQEARNCLLVMVNPDFFQWLRQLADFNHFQTCIALPDNQVLEQYDMELASLWRRGRAADAGRFEHARQNPLG